MAKESFYFKGSQYFKENGKFYIYRKFINCFNVDMSRYVEVCDPRFVTVSTSAGTNDSAPAAKSVQPNQQGQDE